MDRRTLLTAGAALLCGRPAPAAEPSGEDWPQYRGRNRDGFWRETGILERFSGAELQPKWRAPLSNGYSSPTVAAGRVYVSDLVLEPQPSERVHCFDWQTGRSLWSHSYPCNHRAVAFPNGPRAAVTVHQGRAYSLGAVGHLHCFDAATGKLHWSHDSEKEFEARIPTFGISSDPFIDGDRVIVQIGGSKGACVVAFDRNTGEERWRSLNDQAGYGAPVVVNHAGKRVLVVWTGERLAGLEAATGAPLWEYPLRSPGEIDAIISPMVQGDRLFISCWFGGAHMLRLLPDRPSIEKIWVRKGQGERSTDAIHALFTAPLWLSDHLYGVDTFGELRCLDARTGDRVWSTQEAVPRGRNAGAHLVRQGDRVWIFNEKGELIIARLSPQGYQELSRAALIRPTRGQFNQRGGVAWSHPAFAYRHVFARNDEELLCTSLQG